MSYDSGKTPPTRKERICMWLCAIGLVIAMSGVAVGRNANYIYISYGLLATSIFCFSIGWPKAASALARRRQTPQKLPHQIPTPPPGTVRYAAPPPNPDDDADFQAQLRRTIHPDG